MNEEEKKTIEKFIEKCYKYDESVEIKGISVGEEYRMLNTVCKALNLIEKLQKENEEKNKIIDSMIKVMIENSICDYFIKEKCKNYAGENGKTCDECIKQYFENKVKEVK